MRHQQFGVGSDVIDQANAALRKAGFDPDLVEWFTLSREPLHVWNVETSKWERKIHLSGMVTEIFESEYTEAYTVERELTRAEAQVLHAEMRTR